MRGDPVAGCRAKSGSNPTEPPIDSHGTRLINSVLVPIVYLPVQLPTTFEFIINLKRRMPSN